MTVLITQDAFTMNGLSLDTKVPTRRPFCEVWRAPFDVINLLVDEFNEGFNAVKLSLTE